MRNGFFTAIPVALLGAVMVHGQEALPGDSSTPVLTLPLPSKPVAPPYWTAPIPDSVANPPEPILEGAGANQRGIASHAYFSADYLLWSTSKFPVSVPLVTAGTTAGGGQIGRPDTVVLFGDQRVGMGNANGFRLTGGGWLTADGWLGGELSGFVLSQQGASFAASGNGTGALNVLAQPFFSSNSGSEDALRLAAPGIASGSITIGMSSQLRGAEANLFHDLVRSDSAQVSFLLGVRYVNLSESLTTLDTILPQTFVPFGNTFAGPGEVIRIGDRFETHNNFLGPQLGGRFRYQWGIVSADFTGKIALGSNHAALSVIGGSSLTSSVIPSQALPGGLFALPSNSNGGSNSRFCAVPEVGGNIGLQLRPGVFVRVGYTLLYLTSVARAGQQINRNLDATQIPASQFFGLPGGTGQPVFNGTSHSTYFAQGLNLGLEFRF